MSLLYRKRFKKVTGFFFFFTGMRGKMVGSFGFGCAALWVSFINCLILKDDFYKILNLLCWIVFVEYGHGLSGNI